MDLKQHLKGRNLKWNWDSISEYCVKNPKSIDQIIKYCIDDEIILQQNAGAVLGKIVDIDRTILTEHFKSMLDNLDLNPHDAVKRASMRVWQYAEIPEDLEGEIFDVDRRYVSDHNEPIAVRAFTMTVARNIFHLYP